MNDTTNVEAAIANLSQRELGELKVLMIEDDRFLSEMVLTKLSKNGCIPYTTGDGSEAVGLAEQYQPDVIILDLMLPNLSGEEIIAQLKANESVKHIPVIVFSNKSDEADVKHLFDLGAAEFFVKASTDLSTLVERVKRVATGGGAS